MQATLQSLHTVPGVIGGLLSDDDGNVLAHSFPPVFDLPALQGVCSNLNFNLHGLMDATGGVKLLDLRFDHGRVIIRSLQSQVLLLLCEQSVNLQLLTISVNVAIRKIEKLIDQGFKPAYAPPTQPAASVNPIVSATSVPTSIRTDEKGVILTVEILKKTASTFWDSMTESASIGRNTALDISNHFNMGPFKHLTVYNKANGKSARVPVQVIQYDKDGSYNGKIVVTLSLAEQLKVKDGEQLVVEATKGGGVLGWEGI
jgi:predicted regulator of Ras-like GTPase activity (Roadblock/LC7/MglB family)